MIVPSMESPPDTPFTSQAIVVPAGVQKLAVKFCVCPSATFAASGVMEFGAAQEIATLALALSEESARLVAVTITGLEEGTAAGAIYIAVEALPELPVAAMVPTVELPPAIPLTLQDTPADKVPDDETVAVNT